MTLIEIVYSVLVFSAVLAILGVFAWYRWSQLKKNETIPK